ncbi:MAG: cyoD [Burkholderiales bacterium]|jgi:cytochrome o ubiquinol oxidase operon protein cyoD|nr:cyoD [Burkholderiales bacterium]
MTNNHNTSSLKAAKLHSHASSSSNHGSLKSYIIGFILSILLTIIPYYIVVNHTFGTESTYIAITIFAVLQLLVQLIFFLHMNMSPEGRNVLLSFIFTVVVLFILVAGTLWIMYNMNYNMMEHTA